MTLSGKNAKKMEEPKPQPGRQPADRNEARQLGKSTAGSRENILDKTSRLHRRGAIRSCHSGSFFLNRPASERWMRGRRFEVVAVGASRKMKFLKLQNFPETLPSTICTGFCWLATVVAILATSELTLKCGHKDVKLCGNTDYEKVGATNYTWFSRPSALWKIWTGVLLYIKILYCAYLLYKKYLVLVEQYYANYVKQSLFFISHPGRCHPGLGS